MTDEEILFTRQNYMLSKITDTQVENIFKKSTSFDCFRMVKQIMIARCGCGVCRETMTELSNWSIEKAPLFKLGDKT